MTDGVAAQFCVICEIVVDARFDRSRFAGHATARSQGRSRRPRGDGYFQIRNRFFYHWWWVVNDNVVVNTALCLQLFFRFVNYMKVIRAFL